MNADNEVNLKLSQKLAIKMWSANETIWIWLQIAPAITKSVIYKGNKLDRLSWAKLKQQVRHSSEC